MIEFTQVTETSIRINGHLFDLVKCQYWVENYPKASHHPKRAFYRIKELFELLNADDSYINNDEFKGSFIQNLARLTCFKYHVDDQVFAESYILNRRYIKIIKEGIRFGNIFLQGNWEDWEEKIVSPDYDSNKIWL